MRSLLRLQTTGLFVLAVCSLALASPLNEAVGNGPGGGTVSTQTVYANLYSNELHDRCSFVRSVVCFVVCSVIRFPDCSSACRPSIFKGAKLSGVSTPTEEILQTAITNSCKDLTATLPGESWCSKIADGQLHRLLLEVENAGGRIDAKNVCKALQFCA
ncbi:hypothetical protein M3Y99_01641700 [Aphelenchoides fujianensis]|nr:hypothetical protein M3Y99_01641700 [Aphelenchoides fujianensis]